MKASATANLLIGLMFAAALAAPAPGSPEIRWQGWSDGVFERARSERRLVILDLVAVWCHWCHGGVRREDVRRRGIPGPRLGRAAWPLRPGAAAAR